MAEGVTEPLRLFAITAPGLAPLAAEELRSLGVSVEVSDPAGVEWQGTLEQLYDANLRLRTASRVVVRVREFTARAFWELERRARKIPWEAYIATGGTVALRVTSRKSKLYHEGAIAERLAEAIERRVGTVTFQGIASASRPATPPGVPSRSSARGASPSPTPTPDDELDDGAVAQLFIVRVFRDRFTISADASGALLHRRGYRQATAKAPLRETLAAALVLSSGWDRRSPLLDPLCGSGTIPIEAALLARRVAPGLATPDRTPRRFAFHAWPDFDAAVWERVVSRARDEILPSTDAPILGSDRNGGAIRAARSNAERAGVSADITFDTRALSAVEPPRGPGWLITNPPYGVRVGEREALRDLFATLGRVARERLPGWTVALLSADRRLEAQTGLALEERLSTNNGGIPVRVVVGRSGDRTPTRQAPLGPARRSY